MQVCVKTDQAEYIAARPAAAYKKLFNNLTEKADLSHEVCSLLAVNYTVRGILDEFKGMLCLRQNDLLARSAGSK